MRIFTPTEVCLIHSLPPDLEGGIKLIVRTTAAKLLGEPYASKIASLAITLYKTAHSYAYERGLIIADTKFEFGLDTETDEIVLVDEVLTPDSSRFWPKEKYAIGQGQESFDKQYLRDWLTREGLKGKEGVKMTDEVAQKTAEKYKEAWEKITGGGEL
jgi:phosphoribosylaminoimidazole-succinocarboxamide synthase